MEKKLNRWIEYQNDPYYTSLKLPEKNFRKVPREENGRINAQYVKENLSVLVLTPNGELINADEMLKIKGFIKQYTEILFNERQQR